MIVLTVLVSLQDYEEEERQVRVSTIAELLGLTACQFSYVGDSSLRGISGGQVRGPRTFTIEYIQGYR
jgi:hypothetical protein